MSEFRKYYIENAPCGIVRTNIHGVATITATTPLLNLNLNYEKLHHKDK